jgi:hypothetical protein
MTSSEEGNSIDNIAINPDLVHHSEYDIEVTDNNANVLAKDASKLIYRTQIHATCSLQNDIRKR